MLRFSFIFKQFIKYYLYSLIILYILYLIWSSPYILGMILGLIGSLINTFIFEIYLARAKQPDTIHISTGSVWRYLVALVVCAFWYLFKDEMNILGVVVGLMISYVLIILRPLLVRE